MEIISINKKLKQQHLCMAVILATYSLSAVAGTDLTLDGAVDWLLNLMQGGLGKMIALGALLLSAIAWSVSNWKFGLGVLGVIAALVILPPLVISAFPAVIDTQIVKIMATLKP